MSEPGDPNLNQGDARYNNPQSPDPYDPRFPDPGDPGFEGAGTPGPGVLEGDYTESTDDDGVEGAGRPDSIVLEGDYEDVPVDGEVEGTDTPAEEERDHRGIDPWLQALLDEMKAEEELNAAVKAIPDSSGGTTFPPTGWDDDEMDDDIDEQEQANTKSGLRKTIEGGYKFIRHPFESGKHIVEGVVLSTPILSYFRKKIEQVERSGIGKYQVDESSYEGKMLGGMRKFLANARIKTGLVINSDFKAAAETSEQDILKTLHVLGLIRTKNLFGLPDFLSGVLRPQQWSTMMRTYLNMGATGAEIGSFVPGVAPVSAIGLMFASVVTRSTDLIMELLEELDRNTMPNTRLYFGAFMSGLGVGALANVIGQSVLGGGLQGRAVQFGVGMIAAGGVHRVVSGMVFDRVVNENPEISGEEQKYIADVIKRRAMNAYGLGRAYGRSGFLISDSMLDTPDNTVITSEDSGIQNVPVATENPLNSDIPAVTATPEPTGTMAPTQTLTPEPTDTPVPQPPETQTTQGQAAIPTVMPETEVQAGVQTETLTPTPTQTPEANANTETPVPPTPSPETPSAEPTNTEVPPATQDVQGQVGVPTSIPEAQTEVPAPAVTPELPTQPAPEIGTRQPQLVTPMEVETTVSDNSEPGIYTEVSETPEPMTQTETPEAAPEIPPPVTPEFNQDIPIREGSVNLEVTPLSSTITETIPTQTQITVETNWSEDSAVQAWARLAGSEGSTGFNERMAAVEIANALDNNPALAGRLGVTLPEGLSERDQIAANLRIAERVIQVSGEYVNVQNGSVTGTQVLNSLVDSGDANLGAINPGDNNYKDVVNSITAVEQGGQITTTPVPVTQTRVITPFNVDQNFNLIDNETGQIIPDATVSAIQGNLTTNISGSTVSLAGASYITIPDRGSFLRLSDGRIFRFDVNPDVRPISGSPNTVEFFRSLDDTSTIEPNTGVGGGMGDNNQLQTVAEANAAAGITGPEGNALDKLDEWISDEYKGPFKNLMEGGVDVAKGVGNVAEAGARKVVDIAEDGSTLEQLLLVGIGGYVIYKGGKYVLESRTPLNVRRDWIGGRRVRALEKQNLDLELIALAQQKAAIMDIEDFTQAQTRRFSELALNQARTPEEEAELNELARRKQASDKKAQSLRTVSDKIKEIRKKRKKV